MSLERVLRTLEGLGLSRLESKVYVYLAKAGPRKIEELSRGLGMTKRELYPALRGLEKKRIVDSRPELARRFSAIAFEEVLTLLVKLDSERAKAIKEAKQELVDSWSELTKKNNS